MQAILLRWSALVVLAVAAGVAGYVHGLRYEQGRQAVLRAKEAEKWAKAVAEAAERGRQWNAQVAERLDAERRARMADKANFERKLRETRTLVECPGNKLPNPDAGRTEVVEAADPRLGADGVRLWNEALAAGATAAERAGWLASANASAGPADLRRALDNLRANAALLGECREREAMMRDWLCAEGLASCGGAS